MRRHITLFLGSCLMTIQVAGACSTFVAADSHGVVVGRNADASMSIPGLIVVNLRGVYKVAVPWGVITPTLKPKPTAKWESRYGSVTVTALGREFPDGGMNEMGLVVEEMSLPSVYPRSPGRPWISQIQWIQYQLDNFATVNQVLRHLRDFNIAGWGWHFTIADASGECATVDFLNGSPVVSRGRPGEACVLTNSTHRQSVAYVSGLKPGQANPQGDGSLARFARATHALAGYRADGTGIDVQSGFKVLSDIASPGNTFRSIVHDIGRRRIYFRTPKAPRSKYIDLRKLDFSPHAPRLMLNIDAALSGDITGKLVPYTTRADRRVIEGFAQLILSTQPAKKAFTQELRQAGLSERTYVQYLAAYADSPGKTPWAGAHVLSRRGVTAGN